MYCPKCGKQIPDQAQFCSSCGASVLTSKGTGGVLQDVPVYGIQKQQSSAKYIISLLLSCCIIPITVILRLALQETEIKFGWRVYESVEVPDSAKGLMIFLAIAMAATSIILNSTAKKAKEKSSSAPIIISILSIFPSIVITMIQF